ncbi:MAG: hypothetical protein A2087_05800 [Spirochaetes bacterium GWD1_61_31]|nr:MAG: hypothetical protein A2Y37_13660 [Spirochaetes bacterium GWB1_60_80]OHD31516.1 MAG: hypothetical protein A2004_13285 [Spirochaetes bacterium GWC1_61_12]OHD43293.1 MAG: hypothetical protein A2087_05800 [Spirochaetes bacterium GWD1_61_31]OHD45617.1 MAG: hypothetical protein A2Y35_09190 [Spirochaetes bacterium GWE1_60_18]OHD60468.1 MAG: hypothetical protein A2Y32_02880 [Spirochaetes bacterium GWF1_60_12]HAP44731.1 hypothetical protein [Spirochaetaceae bacterium]
MALKAMDLFDAYQKSKLPNEHGFIVSSFFSATSAYSRYEVVSYNNVKSIYPTEEGLTFQSDGKKLHILVEPADYAHKAEEPYIRTMAEKVPHRFSELELHTCKNQTKVYYGKEAVIAYTSFTIMRPTSVNFAIFFYGLPDVFESLALFFEKTLNKEAGVPGPDAKKLSKLISLKLKEAMMVDFSS